MVQQSPPPSLSVATFNNLPADQAADLLLKCNGSRAWVAAMMTNRPFKDVDALFASAEQAWNRLQRSDKIEGFNHHPRIGDLASLKKKFSLSSDWSKSEQSAVASASDSVLLELHERNLEYEQKFGFIFIVCATGKGAAEMLDLLKARMSNGPEEEFGVAASEHAKITKLRLEKVCQPLAR